MKVRESAENYLKTILILQKKLGAVRSIDVVNDEITTPIWSNEARQRF